MRDPQRGALCLDRQAERGSSAFICLLSPSVVEQEETHTEIEVRGRHKQEKDDNEGIIWRHIDNCDGHVSHEDSAREICVTTISGTLRDRGEEQECT